MDLAGFLDDDVSTPPHRPLTGPLRRTDVRKDPMTTTTHRPSIRRVWTGIAAAAVLTIAATGCSPDADTAPADRAGSAAAGESRSTPDGGSTSGDDNPPSEDDGTRLRLTVGDDNLTATLRDSAATDDLLAQLPVSIEMSDFGSVEKIGPLPEPLSTAGQPDGADPVVGDLGYYEPWGNLVLYYGDQSYYDGIVRLGTLHGDIDAIGEYDDVTVRVELAN